MDVLDYVLNAKDGVNELCLHFPGNNAIFVIGMNKYL